MPRRCNDVTAMWSEFRPAETPVPHGFKYDSIQRRVLFVTSRCNHEWLAAPNTSPQLRADPHLVSIPPIIAFLILAIAAHLAFTDFYLLGTGQTRVYITAQEVLLTALFAAILARGALSLIRFQNSSFMRAAVVLLFLVTTASVYWGIKIVLYPY